MSLYPCPTATAAHARAHTHIYIYIYCLYLQPWKKPILSRNPTAEWSFHAIYFILRPSMFTPPWSHNSHATDFFFFFWENSIILYNKKTVSLHISLHTLIKIGIWILSISLWNGECLVKGWDLTKINLRPEICHII